MIATPAVRRAAVALVMVAGLLGAVTGPAGPAAAQDAAATAVCVGDRTGDQRQELNRDRPELAVELDGATDLVEVCAADDGTITVTTAAPTGLAQGTARWLAPGSAITVGLAEDDASRASTYVVIGSSPDGAVSAAVMDSPSTGGDDALEVSPEGGCDVTVVDAVITVASGCAPAADVTALQASLRLVADPTVDYTPVLVDRLPDGGGLAGSTTTPAPARLAGPDRLVTAVEISRAQFPDGSTTAYLARADDLADAVAGGALTDGPVLLVPSCGDVPAVVAGELDRLDPAEVVALGGRSAICEPTLQQAADGRQGGRLAGPDRFTTAAEVAARAFPGGAEEVYLARGDDLADAVAAGSLPSGPVLLVPTVCGSVPDGVHLAVRRMLPSRVVALGGTAAVCEDTLTAAAAGDAADADLDPVRLDGVDRYDTARLIAERAFPGGAPTLFLARADDPADAVAGGSLTEGPTVLVPPCGQLPQRTLDAVDQVRPDRVVSLGGAAAVCDETLAAAGSAAAADR